MGVYVYIRCKNPKFVAKCWHFVTGSQVLFAQDIIRNICKVRQKWPLMQADSTVQTQNVITKSSEDPIISHRHINDYKQV